MKCALCDTTIEPYDPRLHRFEVSEDRAVAICDACALKLTEWQGERLARLFPTTALKKRYPRGKPTR